MKVVLVDDHLVFRESLRIALVTSAGFDVVGEAKTARDACAVVESTRPDLLVTDLLLEDTDGIALVRELRRRGSSVPTLVLTRLAQTDFVRDALALGVRGYALKDESLDELIGAMRAVARGQSYLSPGVQEIATSTDGPNAAGQEGSAGGFLGPLTKREREIFGRVLEGFSNRDIAKTLCISLKTVETHRFRINRKLGVHSTAELIRVAAGAGLVSG
jgi:DNA-binding NarL/FixJ family response regulator